MTIETYEKLKQYVGSRNHFTDDLLNMGYTKGKKDGYNQALKDLCNKLCSNGSIADFMKDYIREKAEELMK